MIAVIVAAAVLAVCALAFAVWRRSRRIDHDLALYDMQGEDAGQAHSPDELSVKRRSSSGS